MNHADVVNLVIFVGTAVITVLLSVVAWLWKQGSRITTNEVRGEEVEKRLNRLELHIMAALSRIETKLDSKADR